MSFGLNVTAGAWNTWDSDITTTRNRLRFFESTQGVTGASFGAYTDPPWATFINGMSLKSTAAGSRPTSWPRNNSEVG